MSVAVELQYFRVNAMCPETGRLVIAAEAHIEGGEITTHGCAWCGKEISHSFPEGSLEMFATSREAAAVAENRT